MTNEELLAQLQRLQQLAAEGDGDAQACLAAVLTELERQLDAFGFCS